MWHISEQLAESIHAVLAAINAYDPERLGPLLTDEVEIVTGRTVHRGRDAALTWVTKRYDHLDRRYRADELHPVGNEVLALGRVEYLWRESGDVADTSPIALWLQLDGPLLVRLRLDDEVEHAAALLES